MYASRSGQPRAGANRWRNPEDDLPADFELNRDVDYDAVRQPLDASAFVAELQRRHPAALNRRRWNPVKRR